ncbi:MAG: winged helix-turn-helix domain-containing protein [Methylococcus sp.]
MNATDPTRRILTARVEEVDRLLGLDLGADDYICKPFSPREVMARIRAIFRRLERQATPGAEAPGVAVDEDSRTIHYEGQPLDLTGTEYRILSLMAARPGRVFSRDRLLDCLHDEGQSASDRAIDTHIKNIRRKLARINPEREILLSVYGAGYKLEG